MGIVFSYKALGQDGKTVEGTIEAESKEKALGRIQELKDRGLTDIAIESAEVLEKNTDQTVPQVPTTKKCPHCSEEILLEAQKCKHCGEWLTGKPKQAQQQQVIVVQGQKSAGVAFILSLIQPGFGQIYCGAIFQGLFLWILCWVLIFFVVTIPIAVIIWIVNWFDAVSMAHRFNKKILSKANLT